MERRQIITKLNQWVTELELIKPRHLVIAINGAYFYVNKIVYDDIHCKLYLDNILVGGAFFHKIDSIEKY